MSKQPKKEICNFFKVIKNNYLGTFLLTQMILIYIFRKRKIAKQYISIFS